MKNLVMGIMLSAFALSATAQTIYVHPDAQGRFEVQLPTTELQQEVADQQQDAEKARAFLAHVYLENSSVWQSDDPVFSHTSTVYEDDCTCTVQGVPQYHQLKTELGE